MQNKRLTLSSVLSLLAFTSVASAQSIGSFSGFYVSAFGEYSGGASAQNDNGFIFAPVAPAPPPVIVNLPGLGDGHYGLSGGFGGGGLGYNMQFDRIVVGVEGDIGGGRASGSSSGCGNPAHVCGTSINAISDLRGKIGYTFDKFMMFVSGGLAIDHVNAYDNLQGASGSAWLTGFVIGAGLEYKLTPNLSLKAEYLHSELSRSHLFSIVPGVPELIAVRSEAARVGINYYFTPAIAQPVTARY